MARAVRATKEPGNKTVTREPGLKCLHPARLRTARARTVLVTMPREAGIRALPRACDESATGSLEHLQADWNCGGEPVGRPSSQSETILVHRLRRPGPQLGDPIHRTLVRASRLHLDRPRMSRDNGRDRGRQFRRHGRTTG